MVCWKLGIKIISNPVLTAFSLLPLGSRYLTALTIELTAIPPTVAKLPRYSWKPLPLLSIYFRTARQRVPAFTTSSFP